MLKADTTNRNVSCNFETNGESRVQCTPQVYQCKLRRACLGDTPAPPPAATNDSTTPVSANSMSTSTTQASGAAGASKISGTDTTLVYATNGEVTAGRPDGGESGSGNSVPSQAQGDYLSNATCAEGFHGPLCSVCDPGYFQFSNTCT